MNQVRTPTCSFCEGNRQADSKFVTSSTGTSLCSECVLQCARVLIYGGIQADLIPLDETHGLFRCSVCGKSQNEVQSLIAERDSFVCNECLLVCFEVLFDNYAEGKQGRLFTLQMLPRETG